MFSSANERVILNGFYIAPDCIRSIARGWRSQNGFVIFHETTGYAIWGFSDRRVAQAFLNELLREHRDAAQQITAAFNGEVNAPYLAFVDWVKRRGQHTTSLIPEHIAETGLLLNLHKPHVAARVKRLTG